MSDYLWLVPLTPWLALAWIGLGLLFGFNRGEQGERQTVWVAGGSVLFSLLYLLLLMIGGSAPGDVVVGQWLSVDKFQVDLGFRLDWTGLIAATLVALIALLTIRFSANYMHREPGFQRFFMIMSLFSGAMLLIVLAGNVVMMFIGWEAAGLSSYLLIGYAYERPNAADNAVRAFVTNRIGDAGFIIAIFLSLIWLGGNDWQTINAGADQLDHLQAMMLASLFVIAALAKSAQLPFAPWIARALEGPTPSSAIFYGSLMVHAGVFLLIRLEPLLLHSPSMMVLIAVLGLATALYGFLSGLVQSDIKSALIFSTSGQVGLMFLWVGLGWFDLALWHLGSHAVWRSYQFLSSPAQLHQLSRPARPVPEFLARRRGLFVAALQRFWVDSIIQSLLVKPTKELAQDLRHFDEHVVTRIIGRPDERRMSLHQQDFGAGGKFGVGRGSGLLGNLMERLANQCARFEESFILRMGGEGLLSILQRVGQQLMKVELLLSQPRYLLLLIMATFVVII